MRKFKFVMTKKWKKEKGRTATEEQQKIYNLSALAVLSILFTHLFVSFLFPFTRHAKEMKKKKNPRTLRMTQ